MYMMYYILYFILITLSCALGAVIGLGGGTLLRPMFDAIAFHSIYNISFLISFAVVVMSVFSTGKKMKGGADVNLKTAILLSLGSVIGGLAGNRVFEHLRGTFTSETEVQLIQTIFTTIILILAIYFSSSERFRYNLKATALFPFLGGLLGFIAVLLGLGGGILVMPVLKVLFSMDTKKAAVLSIIVVFFSHLVNIISLTVSMGFSTFDTTFMPVIVIGGALGGICGAAVSKRVTSETVAKLFNMTIVGLVALNLYNMATFIFW